MKSAKKWIAILCTGAIAVCFASCKPDSGDTEQTSTPPTGTSDVAQAPSASDAAQPEASSAPETPADPAQGNALSKPTDPAAAVKLYNDALAKKTAVSATQSRTLTMADLAVINLLEMEGVAENFALTDAPLQGVDLYELSADNITSMNCAEEGDNFVITFYLNDTKTDASLKAGINGFQYVFDYDITLGVVNEIAQKMMGDALEIEINEDTVEVGLSKGKLVATVNKTTGALSTVAYEAVEHIEGKGKAMGIPGKAKLEAKFSVNYTVTN